MIANSFFEKNKFFKFFGNRCYLSHLIFILLTSVLLYWQFIFGNKIFAADDYVIDAFQQYLKVYEFFATAIKNGELTSYTFQYGFGNSIFSMIGWISDPFSILGVLTGIIFGVEYIGESMIYILILKHICSGLICFRFLMQFKFSVKSSALSSYLFAYSGYMLSIGQHYFFANRPVFFILILLILEKIIKDNYNIKYWCGLFYVSFMIALSGVTAAYEIFLGAGLYALFRSVYIYGKDYKKIFKRLGICLVFVLGGIAASAFTVLPAAEKIMDSNRISHNIDVFSFNSPTIIRAGVLRLFSNQLNGYINQYYGSVSGFNNDFPYFFSVLLVPFIAQYIWKTFHGDYTIKSKLLRLVPVAVVVFTIADSFIPLLFSFFVPHYHSFAYVFYPFFAIVFAEVLDNIKRKQFSRLNNYISMIISIGIIVWGGLSTNNKGSDTSMITLIVSILILLLGCFSADIVYLCYSSSSKEPFYEKIKRVSVIVLSLSVISSSFFENFITVQYHRDFSSKTTAHKVMITDQIVKGVNETESDNFFRFETEYYEGRMFWYTYPFLFPIRATAYYDSSISTDILQFYKQMCNYSTDLYVCKYQDAKKEINNTVTEDILGIKYLLLTTDFQRDGWEKIESYPQKGIALYQNTGINSAGLLFDSYITQEEADKMTFGERALGMATRLVVDKAAQNIGQFAEKYSVNKDENSTVKEQPKNNEDDIFNKTVDIDTVLPYLGTVDEVSETKEGYNVKATMDDEESNFRFSLNTDIINNFNKLTLFSFTLENSEVLKNILYYDTDNLWKSISYLNAKTNDDRTTYSFILPQTASELAFCVNQPCDIDVNISSKTFDISGEAFDIRSAAPYKGTITGVDLEDNKYNIKAAMDSDESNFRFYLNTDVVKSTNNLSQISFKLKNNNVLKNFLYFDSDNSWKEIKNTTEKSVGNETLYTFTIPQTASALALCVNKPCKLDVDISAKVFDLSDSAFKIGTATPYLGTVDKIAVTDKGYNIKATMKGKDSNFSVYLNTDVLDDSRKSTLISFKLKNSKDIDKFMYFDTDKQWKEIRVKPVTNNDMSEYSFIIPQSASCLAMSVKNACKLDVDISVETVTAAYVNEGIQLDNPKRGNTLSGTVTAEKNSLLYLPIPFNKHWNAYIDGKKVDIMKANYAFIAVPITAGKHTVSLIYSNQTFKKALTLSVTAFILMNGFFVFCFVVKKRRKRKKEEEIGDIF